MNVSQPVVHRDALVERAAAPLVLLDELAKLIADAASDVAGIVSLTDPGDRSTDINVYMAHESARDVRDTLNTMTAIIEHMRRRGSLREVDVVDPVTGATCEEAT